MGIRDQGGVQGRVGRVGKPGSVSERDVECGIDERHFLFRLKQTLKRERDESREHGRQQREHERRGFRSELAKSVGPPGLDWGQTDRVGIGHVDDLLVCFWDGGQLNSVAFVWIRIKLNDFGFLALWCIVVGRADRELAANGRQQHDRAWLELWDVSVLWEQSSRIECCSGDRVGVGVRRRLQGLVRTGRQLDRDGVRRGCGWIVY